MPKTTSTKLLKRYPALAEISADEWDSFFPNARVPWSAEELDYLTMWYAYDSILSLSYALGRLPWAVYDRAQKLQLRRERTAS